MKRSWMLLMGFALLCVCGRLGAQVEGREWEETGAPQEVERVLKHFPEGSRSFYVEVPMRDGVRLATSVFLPPGEGPWPVIFQKGFYGRFGMAGGARSCREGEFAFVIQDARGRGDSGGKGTFDPASFAVHVEDMREMLVWLRGQSWCSGRIGVSGGSGNAVSAVHAFLSGVEGLRVAMSVNSSGFASEWMYENRVKRGLASWMSHNNLISGTWPRPQPGPADGAELEEVLRSFGPHGEAGMILHAGWYDILSESALRLYEALHGRARMVVVMGPGWHGGETRVGEAKWPGFWARGEGIPSFTEVLAGRGEMGESEVRYYVMGDPSNPESVGNEWRRSAVWPPPHEELTLYFQGDGGLGTGRPRGEGRLGYVYDPRDPAPAFGGNGSYMIPVGPMDQRALGARADVLRFVTEPLREPLVFAGRVGARLVFSTDAEDTLFVLKLVDVNPDGRETLIRETAAMGRFAEGLDGNTPLRAGERYVLAFDFWSTAWALNPGHRLGVYVTSASVLEGPKGPFEVYEVHPNSFEPVGGPEGMRAARQTIYVSESMPGGITLPVLVNP